MRKLLLVFFAAFSFSLQTQATVIYVNKNAQGQNNGTTWLDAFTELRDALPYAQYGDEVWVAQGIYTPYVAGDIPIAFEMGSGVRLFGGFSGSESLITQRDWSSFETILSGQVGPNSNALHVIYCEHTDTTTLIDGFTIKDGKAPGSCDGLEFSYNCQGGGVYLYSGQVSLPTFLRVANCRFLNNYATIGGAVSANFGLGAGGIQLFRCYFENNDAQTGAGIKLYPGIVLWPVRIDECEFFSNQSSSISTVNYSETPIFISIKNTIFENNFSLNGTGGIGSASYPGAASVTTIIENCVFRGNQTGVNPFPPAQAQGRGAAISAVSIRVKNCVFFDNTAYDGGAITTGEAEIAGCIFVGNRAARDGGAIRLIGKNYLINNTFIDNYAMQTGGAIGHNFNASDTIVNCIFLNNRAGQTGHWMSSGFAAALNVYVDHSLVDVPACSALHEGLDPAYDTLNCGSAMYFNINPLFRDTAGGDFRLRGCSPLLDAGDSAWVARFGLLTDLDGRPRILDTRPALGAYETQAFDLGAQVQDVRCFGGADGQATAQPVGGFAPYLFSWNGQGSDSVLAGLSPGTYEGIGADSDGCIDTLTVDIQQPAPFSFSLAVTSASGPSIPDGALAVQDLSGGSGPYDYLWEHGALGPELTGLFPALYTVTLRDAQGCDSVVSIVLGYASAVGEAPAVFSAHIRPVPALSGDTPPQVDLHCRTAGTYGLSVFDALGTNLWSTSVAVLQEHLTQDLPGNLPKGIYFLRISPPEGKSAVLRWMMQ